MGFLKGAVSFCRFRTAGTLPQPVDPFLGEGFRKHAFQGLFLAEEDRRSGWTGMEPSPEGGAEDRPYNLGDWLLFRLRIDRKVVPPSLFQLRVREAEKRARAERQNRKLYREEKEALREAARRDLLGQVPAVPSWHDLAWIVSRQQVWFSCLTEKIHEDLVALFRESFGLTLIPLVPWDPQVLDPGLAGRLAAPGAAGATPETESWGRDFLTWLWFKSEERGGMIRLGPAGDIALSVLHRIVLATGEGEYAETVTCQGRHAELREGREALRRGKRVREARLRLGRDNAEWEFTFKADRFQFQSLTLPAVEQTEEDREGQDLERLYLVEKAAETMDALFALFLHLRLSDQWEEERVRLQAWVQP